MQPAPPPVNEAERLEALRAYDILDTLPEQPYDDITLVASQICGCPIALVSLVDEHRQWFKSRVGLDATETPRELAFCAHAILEPDQLLVVEDARADQRFHDNPLVARDPNIRFYAGAPLVTDDGLGLGTLCVIDRQPRQLTSNQHHALQALARQVKAQLQLRMAVANLETSAQELEASRQLLAHSNEDLERFAYVAAHDLKAPLRQIKGFADLLCSELGEQVNAEQSQYLEFITSSADRGQSLIEDILAYSRLDSGAPPKAVALDEIIDDIQRDQTTDHGNCKIDCGPLPTINGDHAQLQQLLTNLIGNGLKYNESDEPRIHVSAVACDEGYRVAISDNGIGIPQEHLDKIFDMFVRVHGGSRFQGSGIGLAICKRVMELHEGTIEVCANPDGGSTFTCLFPAHRITKKASDATNLNIAS